MTGPPRPRVLAGLLVLTATSGMVDVVGFLALGRVFCALTTGNVLFLGLAPAGEPTARGDDHGARAAGVRGLFREGHGTRAERRNWALAVVSLGAGAAAGGLLLEVAVSVPIAVAAGCAAVVAMVCVPGRTTAAGR
ncbi:DUF1275 family protein [Streptomyces sp. GSL17-111]|uniref:DUF1275 family protein n=1 Tax=Streptomyces sp. GSL17-111 TaxID=3121596 RepID=UPI0030F388D4